MTALDILRLRMKIGEHEFEAEGPRDTVTAQLHIWRQLAGLGAPNESATAPLSLFGADPARNLVTLRATLSGRQRYANAALLILYGYHTSFGAGHDGELSAAQLRAALTASGYHPTRLDRAIQPHITAGLIRKGGQRKGRTYALTVSGHQHAAILARSSSRGR